VSAGRESRAARISAVGYDYAGRELEVVVACNLCGATTAVAAADHDRYGYPAMMRVCTRCGLGFLSPRLTAAEYADFYRSVYRPLVSAYHGRRIDAETVQVEQRQYATQLVGFLSEHLEQAPASILDVGGSTGAVAATLVEAFGSGATVLDPSPDELAVAAGRGLEIIAGFAEDLGGGDRKWDLVLLCQTIDHLLDVALTLSTLRAAVGPEGRVFVDILDLAAVLQRHARIEEAVKIDHPFYLTAPTARAFFARAGLEVVAERATDDGHLGFLLAPGAPREPDWAQLADSADALIALVHDGQAPPSPESYISTA
jgi:SAM-dependent methyltransferase